MSSSNTAGISHVGQPCVTVQNSTKGRVFFLGESKQPVIEVASTWNCIRKDAVLKRNCGLMPYLRTDWHVLQCNLIELIAGSILRHTWTCRGLMPLL